MSEHVSGIGGGQPTYVYTVDGVRYETHEKSMTVGQIKARVPNIEPGDKLSLEGEGDEPDRTLEDNEEIHFDQVRGTLHFTVVPSASFGG